MNELREAEKKQRWLRAELIDSPHRSYSIENIYRLGHYFLYKRARQNRSSELEGVDLYKHLYDGKLEMKLATIMETALEVKKRRDHVLRQAKNLAQKQSHLRGRLERLRSRKDRGADRLKYALAATEVKVVQQLARSVFRILRGAIALPRAPYREKVLHRLIRDVEKLEETAPHLKGFLERLRGASGSPVRSSGRNGRA